MKQRSRKKRLTTLVLVLVLCVGVGMLLYPTVSDLWNRFHQTRAIADYETVITGMDEERLSALREEARAYNATLVGKKDRFNSTEEDHQTYLDLLSITENGVLGYVEIPSINVMMAIYHGSDESVLQVAVGHVEGTSLPVGGESTHAVLSGHRGLPSARLFTDLDKLGVGDVFYVHVLGETLAYQVDQTKVVLPTELEDLAIVEGEDYCTLLTCTPYGVNTHRLLVRGHRVDGAAGSLLQVPSDAYRLSPWIGVVLVGVPLLLLCLLAYGLWRRKRG